MMFYSTSRRSKSIHAFAFLGATLLSLPAVISAGAQASGPPPPFKPVVSIRYGGAYNGPRYIPHRTILGLVKDEDGQVVSSAMVYMKDVQAKSTLVALVDSSGEFRFGSLSLDHDYEIWAEAGELRSPIRSVTTFMTQNEVSMPLQVRTERNHGTPALKRRSAGAGEATAGQTPAARERESVPAAQK